MPDILVPGSGRRYCPGDSLDHTAPLVWTVPGVVDAAGCARLIALIEARGPQAAPITTGAGFVMRPEIRNNTRVVFDDPALAADLFARVRHTLPPALCGMRVVGANERFRGYRYQPGQRFAAHYDGSFARDPHERSLLTLLLYLNDGFGGGATGFLDFERAVVPRTGTVVLFQHPLLHEGGTVHAGVKYALRSDVMYRT